MSNSAYRHVAPITVPLSSGGGNFPTFTQSDNVPRVCPWCTEQSQGPADPVANSAA